jgi:hypothetical protein
VAGARRRGTTIAAAIEYRALYVGKWSYAESMPVIPGLALGVSLIAQMVIGPIALAYVSRRRAARSLEPALQRRRTLLMNRIMEIGKWMAMGMMIVWTAAGVLLSVWLVLAIGKLLEKPGRGGSEKQGTASEVNLTNRWNDKKFDPRAASACGKKADRRDSSVRMARTVRSSWTDSSTRTRPLCVLVVPCG